MKRFILCVSLILVICMCVVPTASAATIVINQTDQQAVQLANMDLTKIMIEKATAMINPDITGNAMGTTNNVLTVNVNSGENTSVQTTVLSGDQTLRTVSDIACVGCVTINTP